MSAHLQTMCMRAHLGRDDAAMNTKISPGTMLGRKCTVLDTELLHGS